MKKKLFSIALIVVLISFTVAPLWGYSCISYGADSTTATDEQKQDAALSTYFNYRGGYFVASAGGAGVALQMARNYIDEFYVSSSNTTSIHSTSDFLAHVTFRNTNDHWGIYIDNNGVVFLDNLVKWLLGKNEFPNLYSGGAWGVNSDVQSLDDVYSGFVTSGSLYYVVSDVNTNNPNTSLIAQSDVLFGSPVSGYSGSVIFNQYLSNYSLSAGDFLDRDNKNSNLGISGNYTFTFNYASDVSDTIYLYRYNGYTENENAGIYAFQPYLAHEGGANITYENQRLAHTIYSNTTYKIRGNPCYICVKNSGSNYYYRGFIGVNYTTGYVAFYLKTRLNSYTPADATVNFETYQFDKNDVGSESGTAPGVEFVPKEETENNTYNYYNYNDYSEKQFIENYVEKYVVKKTIIDGSSQDPGDNPGGGGGSDTPGSGSGNITPDGNGGFNFTLPDIGWPDFSGFDFNISGLSEKFPFSIPFDLMAFFTVLNAEPETPEIQGQIDLGIVQWDIDWNLEDFDGLASLLRNLEFIGFCLALILITRSIIKG